MRSRFHPARPLARVPRDLAMSLFIRRPARLGVDPNGWMYDHHVGWHAQV
jgi:hypothetical protein